jgi:hypothetical protein
MFALIALGALFEFTGLLIACRCRRRYAAAGRVERESEEGTEHDIASVSEIEEASSSNRGGFSGGMVFQPSTGTGAQRRDAGIGPDIRPPTPLLTEFDIVDGRRVPFLEQRQ